jgi:hypothetical protein
MDQKIDRKLLLGLIQKDNFIQQKVILISPQVRIKIITTYFYL